MEEMLNREIVRRHFGDVLNWLKVCEKLKPRKTMVPTIIRARKIYTHGMNQILNGIPESLHFMQRRLRNTNVH